MADRRAAGANASAAVVGLAVALALPASGAAGVVVAPYDLKVEHMDAPAADLEAVLDASGAEPYFERPIPRVIHQIWLGDAAAFVDDQARQWQQYALDHGYTYHLWTDHEDDRLRRILGEALYALMDECRSIGLYMGASDVLRYALLERAGGAYFDVDIPPPAADGATVDLGGFVPLAGAVFMSEGQAREIGNGAIYLQNCIMMASRHHPIVRRLVASLVPNRKRWMERGGAWDSSVWYVTGQHLLTRSLAGPFTLIPYNTIAQLGMDCFQPEAYFVALREKIAARRALGIAGRVAPVHRDEGGREVGPAAWEHASGDAFSRANYGR